MQDFIQPHMFSSLLKLCKKELELETLPKIELVPQILNDGQPSFGEYGNNTIKIVIKDRHFMDVARTLCHELVHWKQDLENIQLDGSTGSEIENQANAVAGIVMRKFGRMYPEYFQRSF